jgi:hypothetical protein
MLSGLINVGSTKTRGSSTWLDSVLASDSSLNTFPVTLCSETGKQKPE